MRWIPIDYYHQKPESGRLYTISDGARILHDMCFIGVDWFHVDSEQPVKIAPTHYLELELPK